VHNLGSMALSFKSFTLRASEVDKRWYVIDAAEATVGRVASYAALVLMGKHKPEYTPHMDGGDNLIIINANKARFSGKKMRNKRYYWHTGYPGGLKETTPAKLLADANGEKCTRIFTRAIKGMLSKTPMGRQRLSNVYIYSGPEHPHGAQQPQKVSVLCRSVEVVG